MEPLIRAALLATLAAALLGCGAKEVTSADVKPVDAYPGLTGEKRVEAIRNDPKVSSMERSQKISDAQKEAGLPVTGQ